MTTFPERAVIQRDAALRPFDQGFISPGNTSAPAVEAAVNFMNRIQSACEDIAYDILVAAQATGIPVTGTERDSFIWAQQVTNGERKPGLPALRLVLAHFDDVTPAELANVLDSQIKDFLVTIIPILANSIIKR